MYDGRSVFTYAQKKVEKKFGDYRNDLTFALAKQLAGRMAELVDCTGLENRRT